MAGDIEGTTTEQGQGGRTSSRSVYYSGAAVHLNTGGQRANIDITSGNISRSVSADLGAADLLPRSVSADVNTTPQVNGPTIDEQTFAEGMNKVAKAAEYYADSIATAKAQQASLAYRGKLFDLFNGKTDENGKVQQGYLSTKGMSAIDGYGEFSKQVDGLLKESLADLPAAARQKAIGSLFEDKQRYLSKAVEHSVQEKNKYVDGLKQAERDSITQELQSYPPDALGKTITGADGKQTYVASDLKRRFFSTFDSNEFTQANKQWGDQLASIGERIYLDGRGKVDANGVYRIGKGLEDVKVYRDVIGRAELSGEQLVALDKKIFAFENKELENNTSNYNMREAQEKRYIAKVQNTNEAKLMSALYDGKQTLSPSQVWDLAASQQISEAGARSYVSVLDQKANGKSTKTNPAAYAHLNNLLHATEASDFITPEGESVVNMVLQAQDISIEDKKSFSNKFFAVREKGGVTRENEIKKLADILSPSTKDVYGQKTTEADRLEYLIHTTYDSKVEHYRETLTVGQAHDKAIKDIKQEFSSAKEFINVLPPMHDNKKPSDLGSLKTLVSDIKKKKDAGTISEEEYSRQMSLANTYFNAINNTNPSGKE